MGTHVHMESHKSHAYSWYCVYGILALHANFQVAVVNNLWLISMPSNWLGDYYPGEAYWLVEEGDSEKARKSKSQQSTEAKGQDICWKMDPWRSCITRETERRFSMAFWYWWGIILQNKQIHLPVHVSCFKTIANVLMKINLYVYNLVHLYLNWYILQSEGMFWKLKLCKSCKWLEYGTKFYFQHRNLPVTIFQKFVHIYSKTRIFGSYYIWWFFKM